MLKYLLGLCLAFFPIMVKSAEQSISCQSRYDSDVYLLALSVRDLTICHNESSQSFIVDKIEADINGLKLYIQNSDFPDSIYFFIQTPVKEIQKNISRHVIELGQTISIACENSQSLVHLCLLLQGDLVSASVNKAEEFFLKEKSFSKLQTAIVRYCQYASTLKKKKKTDLQEQSDQLASCLLTSFIENPAAIFAIEPNQLMQFMKNVELISCTESIILDAYDVFIASCFNYIPTYVSFYHDKTIMAYSTLDEKTYFNFFRQMNGSVWLLKTFGSRYLSLVENSTVGLSLKRLDASSLLVGLDYLRCEAQLKASTFVACNKWAQQMALDLCVKRLEEVTAESIPANAVDDFSYYGRYGMSGLILKNWLQLMSVL